MCAVRVLAALLCLAPFRLAQAQPGFFVPTSGPGGASWGASIGLFSDPLGSSCNMQVQRPPGLDTLYVSLSTEGLPESIEYGLGVGFKIEGIPPGWFVRQLSGPATEYFLGDPLGTEGALLSFYGLHASSHIPLYTYLIGPSPGESSAVLHVAGTSYRACWGDPPPCPFVSYDELASACHCVHGGILYVNTPGDCTVGVEPSTWSRVKVLYER